MRETINTALKDAMKAQDRVRLGTLRLINAAIKDRDIEARGTGQGPISDDDIRGLLQKMIKQRRESAAIYEQAGRTELCAQERAEIVVIEDFLPRQLSEDETRTAIAATIKDLGAAGLRDMGRVMAMLKEKYAGQIDFSKAGPVVKELLG